MGAISALVIVGIILLIAAGIKGVRDHATDDKIDHIPLDAERATHGLPHEPNDPANGPRHRSR